MTAITWEIGPNLTSEQTEKSKTKWVCFKDSGTWFFQLKLCRVWVENGKISCHFSEQLCNRNLCQTIKMWSTCSLPSNLWSCTERTRYESCKEIWTEQNKVQIFENVFFEININIRFSLFLFFFITIHSYLLMNIDGMFIARTRVPMHVIVRAIAWRRLLWRTRVRNKLCVSTLTIWWPSKKKQGTTFTTARPADIIVIYFARRAWDSGKSGFKNWYFGIQSETSSVR